MINDHNHNQPYRILIFQIPNFSLKNLLSSSKNVLFLGLISQGYNISCVLLSMSHVEIHLKQKDVSQLLKLQQLFHSHYLTEELLNEMIALYVRFVQNIHHNQNLIRLYFMEKIRFVVSRPEVIKSLDKQSGNKGRTGTQRSRNTERNRNEDIQLRKLTEEAKEEAIKAQGTHPHRKNAQNSQLMEKERNMKIEMQLKIMKEVEENMNTLREDYQKQTKIKEEKINKIVNEQDQLLSERRANRRNKNRKKSANFNEKEVVDVETPPPIPLKELKEVQKIIHLTYERFTRLTQNKMKIEPIKHENEGRVKYHMNEKVYEDQQFFDQLNEQKPKPQPQPQHQSKPQPQHQSQPQPQHQSQHQPQPKQESPPVPIRDTTTVQYKTFDQNKGRVTVRNNQYEQIGQQQF